MWVVVVWLGMKPCLLSSLYLVCGDWIAIGVVV